MGFEGERACLSWGDRPSTQIVLEIAQLRGYMTFWMERQGAKVTAFDLSEDHKWDLVPFAGVDMEALNVARKAHLQRLHNSWWFTRKAYPAQRPK